jgi:hypothetical protein
VELYSKSRLDNEYSVVPFSRDKETLKSRVEEFARKQQDMKSIPKDHIMHYLEDLDKRGTKRD